MNFKSPLAIIFFTVFIDLVGFGIVIPVLPLYTEHLGATAIQIGLITGIYSLMTFVFSPVMGKLSDRFGRRPVLLISIVGTAFGFVLMGLARTLWLLFAARALDGITGANISTAQAYIADVTPPEKRSKSMGLIGAAFGLGFIFGPAIGGLLSPISAAAPFYFAAALACVNAVLVFFFLPETVTAEMRAHPQVRQPAREIFSHGRGGVLAGIMTCYFLMITGFSMMTFGYALFTEHRFGFDARHNGYVFALIGVIAATIQGGLMGRLNDRFGEKTLVRVGLICMAVSMLLLPQSSGVIVLLAVTSLLALGNSFATPTMSGLLSQNVDRGWQGRALGLMQSSGSLGRFIGPTLAGFLLAIDQRNPAHHFGQTPFWTSAAILFVAFLVALGFSARTSAGLAAEPVTTS